MFNCEYMFCCGLEGVQKLNWSLCIVLFYPRAVNLYCPS